MKVSNWQIFRGGLFQVLGVSTASGLGGLTSYVLQFAVIAPRMTSWPGMHDPPEFDLRSVHWWVSEVGPVVLLVVVPALLGALIGGLVAVALRLRPALIFLVPIVSAMAVPTLVFNYRASGLSFGLWLFEFARLGGVSAFCALIVSFALFMTTTRTRS